MKARSGWRLWRAGVAATLAACLPLAGALAAGSPIPQLRPSPRPSGDPPMRVLRVTSADPACAPDCPEWISAEGTIRPGSAAALARIVDDLGGRRLPVLVSSHGGSVRDALEMGRLIRAKGLAVAVARTLIANCPPRSGACPDPLAQVIVGGAVCASACPLVLAGGVERLIGPAPRIGVHQITTILKEPEGVAGLTKTVKVYEQEWVDATVADYLTAMGVGEPVMTLLRKTPAASIRWLSLDEIKDSGLASGALDPAQPILVDGANGLKGQAFDDAGPPDALTASAMDSGGSGAGLSLTYRRGGGALGLVLTQSGDRPAASSADWTLAAPGDPPLVMSAARSGAPAALLPRARFCALGRDVRIVVTPPPAASPPLKPITFDLGAAPGVAALLDEACP